MMVIALSIFGLSPFVFVLILIVLIPHPDHRKIPAWKRACLFAPPRVL